MSIVLQKIIFSLVLVSATLLLTTVPRELAAQTPPIDTVALRKSPVVVVSPDSVIAVPNHALLSFDHVLSLYYWGTSFAYNSLEHNGYQLVGLSSYQVFLSALSRLQTADNSRSSQATLLLNARQQLPTLSGLALAGSIYGTAYLNSASIGTISIPGFINRQVDGYAALGPSYQIGGTDMIATLLAGVARQSTTNDQSFSSTSQSFGSIFRGSFDAPQEWVSDNNLITAHVLTDERFFRDRNQRTSNDHAQFSLASRFPSGVEGQQVENNAALGLTLLRRAFFFPIDSTTTPVKQDRKELGLLLSDSLRYPFLDRFSSSASFQIEPRSVTRFSDAPTSYFNSRLYSNLSTLFAPNQISSLGLRAGIRINYSGTPNSYDPPASPQPGIYYVPRPEGFGISAEGNYDEHTENVNLLYGQLSGVDNTTAKHLAETLDQASYSAKTTTARTLMSYTTASQDGIHAEIGSRIFSYDAPNQNNHDGRDELLTQAAIGFYHPFPQSSEARRLDAGLEVRASRTHLVYLRSDRSAQNYVTRALSLDLTSSFSAPGIFNLGSSDIFANYTVLDYFNILPLLSEIGSYTLRGIYLHDTLSLDVPRILSLVRLSLSITSDARITERGSYNDSAFSEQRTARTTELSGQVLLNFESETRASYMFQAGIRVFALLRDGTSPLSPGLMQFDQLERQIRLGPVLTAQIGIPGYGPSLSLSLWYAFLHTTEFDVPSELRSRQLESHMVVQWYF